MVVTAGKTFGAWAQEFKQTFSSSADLCDSSAPLCGCSVLTVRANQRRSSISDWTPGEACQDACWLLLRAHNVHEHVLGVRMTELKERDAMVCRACGNEERASEGYPCHGCGTFICQVCSMKGVTLCRRCAARAETQVPAAG